MVSWTTVNHHAAIKLANFPKPFFIDFNKTRFQQPMRELLLKAINAKKSSLITVCDLTAGFGQDAYLMHCYGCQLHLVERSLIIAQLLQDGLRRAQVIMPLFIGEALAFIQQCQLAGQQFEVVYFDPMFSMQTQKSLVKKSAQILRQLAIEDTDPAAIFASALNLASKRLVVKRPRLGAQLVLSPLPDIVYKGKSVRFDVYLRK